MTSFNPNYIPLQAKRVQNLTPVARYDLNDLEANQEFQRVSERFLGSIGEDDDIFI